VAVLGLKACSSAKGSCAAAPRWPTPPRHGHVDCRFNTHAPSIVLREACTLMKLPLTEDLCDRGAQPPWPRLPLHISP
jgi:hypothetical protein